MKIWTEFNSSHSSNITIIASFENSQNANKAFDMIEDFALASWEERYLSVEDFKSHWEVNFHSNLKYLPISNEELEIGLGDSPDISLQGDTIKITRFSSDNFSGVVKLMKFSGARKITIEE